MANEALIPLMKQKMKTDNREGRTTLGIIGTGNFAVALAKRLTMSGYDVIMGSRRPEARQNNLTMISDCLCGVELTSIAECFRKASIIFVALHMEDFKITLEPFVDAARGKILIDVSNREHPYAAISNAEHLASVLKHSIVVKGFNSISAYTLESFQESGSSHKVFIASNDSMARNKVADIAKTMGFSVVDLGGIRSARFMEEFVLRVFSHWKIPIIFTFGIFNLWSLYIVYLYFIEASVFQWEQVFLKVLNKPLCMTAITVLAITYLPSQLASIVQVYNGTKHKQFPRFLATWLKSRKQFGLISFFLITIHVIASTVMMSPTYYSSWFRPVTVTVPANVSVSQVLPVSPGVMIWKGEAACLVGITAFVILAIVAVTSIPSVGDSLNWSEWRCIHSKLSLAGLILTVGHVCIMGAPNWVNLETLKLFKSITFLSILLPLLVILLRLTFGCPPLSGYLRKIRRGWERNSESQISPLVQEEPVTILHQFDEKMVNGYQGVRLESSCCCDNTAPAPSTSSCNQPKSVSFNVQCECSAV
ncbi:metalloreductase STEAP4 [Biomphalaria glabrata]|uniref:Metalloreductase STEAP4-like n=1 Tax=Biomphalaria glabrata TaxID=6526 RepID=A0A9W2Z1F2_BIOGL|nr:metalloreductase STEAP4-like [Biomphalaria glabrata]XP_055868762.1 metalloreductase STEAP4-like [Biomphalaria glabrata]XP_055868764.1 metalloreductase STEAP4-like [Biomphalaria glabrata]XP_055868765.1 metalloreductase STEAP4-like [Biomphalaria glabrata]KAI8733624.1 metalloreductase STEAP4-like [Biomphalaria glabrata]